MHRNKRKGYYDTALYRDVGRKKGGWLIVLFDVAFLFGFVCLFCLVLFCLFVCFVCFVWYLGHLQTLPGSVIWRCRGAIVPLA